MTGLRQLRARAIRAPARTLAAAARAETRPAAPRDPVVLGDPVGPLDLSTRHPSRRNTSHNCSLLRQSAFRVCRPGIQDARRSVSSIFLIGFASVLHYGRQTT